AAKETPNCAIAAQCGQDNLTPLKFKKEPFDTVAALVTLGSQPPSDAAQHSLNLGCRRRHARPKGDIDWVA
ncbi:hypothetical protein, partial [uncultured Roseobacter sp.]|uniref:hypothetical protein n=1 Tax=uncultured Roseobacter sp. TaxID=114847 RepID=UPI0026318742